MRTLKKLTLVGVIIASAGLFSQNVDAAGKGKVSISSKKCSITEGKTKTIKLKNVSKKVKWSSSNSKIVKVTKVKGKKKNTAVVKAKSSGKATIKAKCDGKTYKCVITVKKKPSTDTKSTESNTKQNTTESNTKQNTTESSTNTSTEKTYTTENKENNDNNKSEETPALHMHSFSYEIVDLPTCLEGGSLKVSCSICGYSAIEQLGALGHDLIHGADATFVLANGGRITSPHYYHERCSRCLYYNDKHVFDENDKDSVEIVEPTETQHGKNYITCSCGRVKERDLHYIKEWDCINDDFSTGYCTVCSQYLLVPHVFVNGVCTECGYVEE